MDHVLESPADAALQHKRGTINAAAPRHLMSPTGHLEAEYPSAQHEGTQLTTPALREVFIQGITKDGKTFRPSDWAERLAGAMSCFRPGGSVGGPGAFIGYSPYCVPRVINGVKCVIVNEALRDIELMAWDFVMNFARDNNLQVTDACLLPGPPKD
jgi:hypothetical protein